MHHTHTNEITDTLHSPQNSPPPFSPETLDSGPLPCCSPGVVVHVVDPAAGVPSHLPARGEGLGPLPGGAAGRVVHVVPPAQRVDPNLPPGNGRELGKRQTRETQMVDAMQTLEEQQRT